MKAARILHAAHAAGVHIEVDKGDLVLEADSAPPDEIVEALFSAKAAIIALLETQVGISNSEKCVPLFPDTGLTQFDKNWPLPEPLVVDPYERAINTWLNNNPVVTQPDRCAWCFKADQPDHAVVPFGIHSRGHVWLHGECWDTWQKHRRQMAVRALQDNVRCPAPSHSGEVLRPETVVENSVGEAEDQGGEKP